MDHRGLAPVSQGSHAPSWAFSPPEFYFHSFFTTTLSSFLESAGQSAKIHKVLDFPCGWPLSFVLVRWSREASAPQSSSSSAYR